MARWWPSWNDWGVGDGIGKSSRASAQRETRRTVLARRGDVGRAEVMGDESAEDAQASRMVVLTRRRGVELRTTDK